METNWVELVSEYEKSSLTQAEWCRQKGIKINQLQYYKNKFSEELSGKKPANIFAKATIYEVATNIQGKSEYIELRLNDIAINVSENTNEALLIKVLKAAKQC